MDSSRCLVCESAGVQGFLDLGRQALANGFPTREELGAEEARYPLRVGFCHECGHVQLLDRVPPAEMFSNYLYISSASETLKRHFDELSEALVRRHEIGPDDRVIDIGCNDGTLLAAFARRGAKALGVDPAANLAEGSRDAAVERYVGFFGAAAAGEIAARWGEARLVTATNTFPHIPDLQDFIEGIETVLAPGGAFVLEAHYLVDLLEQGAFDTVYHEHVSYWSLGPLSRLFERHGMEVVDAERLPIHHGQLRVTVMRKGEGRVDPAVDRILRSERELGLDRFETYAEFARRVEGIRRELLEKLAALQRDESRLAGYGAPAKASTLLQYVGLDSTALEFIADRSPLKQGRYVPGSHIPIVAPDRILSDRPDFLLLLAWNFVDEILAQQAAYRESGGKFILPLPHVQVI